MCLYITEWYKTHRLHNSKRQAASIAGLLLMNLNLNLKSITSNYGTLIFRFGREEFYDRAHQDVFYVWTVGTISWLEFKYHGFQLEWIREHGNKCFISMDSLIDRDDFILMISLTYQMRKVSIWKTFASKMIRLNGLAHPSPSLVSVSKIDSPRHFFITAYKMK